MSDEYVPQPWRMEGYYPDQYAKTSASLDFALDYDDETFDRHKREFLADLKAYVAEQQVLALREAAESALREAADDLRIESENAEPEKPSAYREGVAAGLLQAEDIVRTRADSIRAEREDAKEDDRG